MLALNLQIRGKAIITCNVDAFGKLKLCRVEAETPPGLGFGAAALSMAAAFQIRPQSLNGKFVEGGEVTIPLRFLPAPEEEPARPPVSSPRRLELARKLLAFSSGPDTTAAQVEDLAVQLDTAKTAIPSFGQMATALRQSYPPRAAEAREAGAGLLAATFSEKELAALVRYFSGADGAALLAAENRNPALMKKINDGLAEIARIAARDYLCDVAGCITPGANSLPELPADRGGFIAAPEWSQQPTRRVINQFRPPVSESLQIGGVARLTCVVGLIGAMEQCDVVSEAPRGVGFAAGARSLASYYRLNPSQVTQGAAGRRVAIDIAFEASTHKPPDPLPVFKARSEHALALARELLTVQDSRQGTQAALRALLDDQRKQALASGLNPADFEVLRLALDRGADVAMRQGDELTAAYLTTVLSDQQLKGLTQFWRGPVGTAWKAKSPEVIAKSAVNNAQYGRLMLVDAGAAFCKVSDCDGKSMAAHAADGQVTPANPAPSTRNP
jgi:hypothetical protein